MASGNLPHTLTAYDIHTLLSSSSSNFLIMPPSLLLIRLGHTRQPLLHRLRIGADNATIPPHLILIMFHILQRPLLANGVLIPKHEDFRIIPEQPIDILERAVGRFRVEEIDDGHERGVEDGPDDVEFPLQGLDADGCDFDNHEVEGPIRSGAEGSPFGAVGEGVDFGWVEPGDALPADAEEDVVEEEEGDGRRGDFCGGVFLEDFAVPDEDRDHEVAETLAG